MNGLVDMPAMLPTPGATGPIVAMVPDVLSSGFAALVSLVQDSGVAALSPVAVPSPEDAPPLPLQSAVTIALTIDRSQAALPLPAPHGAPEPLPGETPDPATRDVVPTEAAAAWMPAVLHFPAPVLLARTEQAPSGQPPAGAPGPAMIAPMPGRIATTADVVGAAAVGANVAAVAERQHPRAAAQASEIERPVGAAALILPALQGPAAPIAASPGGAAAAPPAELVATQRHLDLARDHAWLDDLARDIVGMAARGGRLAFTLSPTSLGHLDVEVRRSEGGIALTMAAKHDDARALLSAAQPQLVDEVRAQGVRVVSAEVSGGGAYRGDDRAPPPRPYVPLIEARDAPRDATPQLRKSPADGRYA